MNLEISQYLCTYPEWLMRMYKIISSKSALRSLRSRQNLGQWHQEPLLCYDVSLYTCSARVSLCLYTLFGERHTVSSCLFTAGCLLPIYCMVYFKGTWQWCPCNFYIHSVEAVICLLIHFRMGNILLILRSHIEEYYSYFTAWLISVYYCYLFFLQTNLWPSPCVLRLSSKQKRVLLCKSLWSMSNQDSVLESGKRERKGCGRNAEDHRDHLNSVRSPSISPLVTFTKL